MLCASEASGSNGLPDPGAAVAMWIVVQQAWVGAASLRFPKLLAVAAAPHLEHEAFWQWFPNFAAWQSPGKLLKP